MSTPDEKATTAPPTQAASATADTARPAPPAPKRRGMQGNAKSMVLSMIACLVGCLVILALIPRQGATKLPTVQASQIAREVSSTKKWDVAIADGLGAPWRAVNVAVVPGDKDHAERWRAGYQGDGEDYVSIQQTKGGGQAWINDIASGSNAGDVSVGGVTWRKVEMEAGQKGLVRTQPLSGLDTVVTGKGSWAQLQQIASAATPYSRIAK